MAQELKSTPATAARALVLALVAGYIDAYSLVNFKVFASFMSGNTTTGGSQLGLASLSEAARNLLPIPLFVLGVFVGALILHSKMRHRLARLLMLVAALVAVVMAAQLLGTPPDWFNVITLSFAMGAMNNTMTHVGAQPISLGYVTGNLNQLGQHLALTTQGRPPTDSQGEGDTASRRAMLLAGIWAAFFVGAILAGALTVQTHAWTLLAPAVVLGTLAVLDLRNG